MRADDHDLFAELRVKAGEDGYIAHLAPDDQSEGRLRFHPAAALDGLTLERPSLALARDHRHPSPARRIEDHDEWSVVADFAARAGWLVQDGCAVELGAEASTAPLALALERGATRVLRCAPAITTLVAPLPGTVSRPTDLRGRNAHLTFHYPGQAGHEDRAAAPRRAAPASVPQHEEPGTGGTTSTATVRGRGRPRLRLGAADVPLRVDVMRPADMLLLTFEFVNLHLDPSGPRLVRNDPAADTYVIVHFPPQHIAETAWPTTITTILTIPSPIGPPQMIPINEPFEPDRPYSTTAMARGSRLSFRVPDAVGTIAYTLHDLLDWSRLTPQIHDTARLAAPHRSPGPTEPGSTDTALEIPYRLILSPSEQGAWVHAVDPVALKTPQGGTRTELWHTRLATPVDDPTVDGQAATARAIWTPYYNRADVLSPFALTALREEQRLSDDFAPVPEDVLRQIVALSGSRTVSAPHPRGYPSKFTMDSQPLEVNRLMLSALGGWLDTRGQWSADYVDGLKAYGATSRRAWPSTSRTGGTSRRWAATTTSASCRAATSSPSATAPPISRSASASSCPVVARTARPPPSCASAPTSGCCSPP